MKVKGKHVILSFVCLVLGFMISYSYQITKNGNKETKTITDNQWERENTYLAMIINQEQKNRELKQAVFEKQEQLRKLEEEIGKQDQVLFNLVEEIDKYRLYVGEYSVHGPGVVVSLEDASYIPTEANVNNYIVHEAHIFKVITELIISGAEAVAINGQRLSHSSYIYCNGPVINVDGTQHPAPFIISAIGDPDVLYPALNITGGIKDQLVNDNIVIKIEKKDDILLDPIITDGE
ncbi:DUF881 domain-containing protein [Bacillus sp. HMF5848]|uniref:DUF881 domain-containing protein n=1 Tax=Bacillus sp. HMF5848 TaxID=2495421 RepID=UPI000F7AF3B1|nr:DUF881 domain-containing protein [Bacillus sp. HMF5848]